MKRNLGQGLFRLTLGLSASLAACDLPARQAPDWTISSEIMEVGEGADELFESVRFGRILADGRMLVGDAGLLEIRIYNPAGNRQVVIGGEGSGPGEFGSLDGIWLLSDGRIGSWDATNRRAAIFDSEGGLVATHGIGVDGEAAGNLEVFFGVFGNEDILLGALTAGDRSAGDAVVPDRWGLARFGPRGELRGMLDEIPGLWRMARAPTPFSPVPQLLIRRDAIWIADPYTAEIVIRDGQGAHARTIALPMMGVTADDAQNARDALERELRSREAAFFLNLLDEVPETEKIPSIAGLLMDEETGNVWVKAYDPGVDAIWLKKNAMQMGPGGEWLVIRPTGESVARVQIPSDYTLLDVHGGRLLAIARDTLDIERVVLLEFER